MFETWNPTGNPVHFIIELADVLAGSYLRFNAASPATLPAARAEFDAVQDGVMVWADLYGHERGVVVNAAVAWLVNQHHSRGLTPDLASINDILGNGILNSLEAMCQFRPACRLLDVAGPMASDVRDYRQKVLENQNGGWRNLRKARAALFTLMAEIGLTVPAHIQARNNQPGPIGVVTFCDLPPVLPEFDAEQPGTDRGRPTPPSPRRGYESCDLALLRIYLGGATTAETLKAELREAVNDTLRKSLVAAWKRLRKSGSGMTERAVLGKATPTFIKQAKRVTSKWSETHGRPLTVDDLDTTDVQK